MLWDDKPAWYVVGRLIKQAASYPVELPPIGALAVEATHAWQHRGPAWPIQEAVGWVERIDPEDPSRPISGTNARVVLRLFDPGDREPLQPWVNANFYTVMP